MAKGSVPWKEKKNLKEQWQREKVTTQGKKDSPSLGRKKNKWLGEIHTQRDGREKQKERKREMAKGREVQ
jgi:hypothetical protein